MTRFKQEIVDKMLTDPDLFSAIAKEKGVLPGSLAVVIRRNSASINEYRIVKLVSDYLGRDMEDLMEAPLVEVQS